MDPQLHHQALQESPASRAPLSHPLVDSPPLVVHRVLESPHERTWTLGGVLNPQQVQLLERMLSLLKNNERPLLRRRGFNRRSVSWRMTLSR